MAFKFYQEFQEFFENSAAIYSSDKIPNKKNDEK